MSRQRRTSEIINLVIETGLKVAAVGAVITFPGMAIALEKPLAKYLSHLDKKARQRELQRILYAMKHQNYLSGDYSHGLQITEKARRRYLTDRAMTIQAPVVWDGLWRIIIFDIPEKHKAARDILTRELRAAGCFQLQKSTWITPFPCREFLSVACTRLTIDRFVSYFEASYLDNEAALLDHVKERFRDTKFRKKTVPHSD